MYTFMMAPANRADTNPWRVMLVDSGPELNGDFAAGVTKVEGLEDLNW